MGRRKYYEDDDTDDLSDNLLFKSKINYVNETDNNNNINEEQIYKRQWESIIKDVDKMYDDVIVSYLNNSDSQILSKLNYFDGKEKFKQFVINCIMKKYNVNC